MRRLLAITAAAALLLATPAAASSVKFQGAVTTGPQIRPRTLTLSVDGTTEGLEMKWRSWGGPTAVGYGAILWHGCNPSCAQDTPHHARGSVHLSHIHYCEAGAFYAKVSVYVYKHGRLILLYGLPANYAPC